MEDRTLIKPGAPPPPSEVKVRTMRSDLTSMAQSGGGMPRFENVAVDGLSIEKEYGTPSRASNPMPAQPAAFIPAAQPVQPTAQPIQPATQSYQPAQAVQSAVFPASAAQAPAATVTEPATPKKDIYPIFIVAVVAILAIGGVSYFAYITFFATSASQTPEAPAQSATLPPVETTPTSTAAGTATTTAGTTITSTTSQTATSPAAELSTAHISLFKKPADQIITVDLTGTTAGTYRKIMSGSLSSASASASMIEIIPKGSDGGNLSIQGLLSVAGAPIVTPQALSNFSPDATFFVYRDKNGLWPGYVLSLNAGQTSSSAMASVQQLETSSNISNAFLVDPGTQSSDGFTGSVVSGVPVRILPFTGLSVPSYFTYGWYGNYLILSTSKNGFGSAVADLK